MMGKYFDAREIYSKLGFLTYWLGVAPIDCLRTGSNFSKIDARQKFEGSRLVLGFFLLFRGVEGGNES